MGIKRCHFKNGLDETFEDLANLVRFVGFQEISLKRFLPDFGKNLFELAA